MTIDDMKAFYTLSVTINREIEEAVHQIQALREQVKELTPKLEAK